MRGESGGIGGLGPGTSSVQDCTSLRAATNASMANCQILTGVGGGNLRADPRLPHRHDRIAERHHVHAASRASPRPSSPHVCGVAEHDRDDGVLAGQDVEFALRSSPAGRSACFRGVDRAARTISPASFERLERCAGDCRGEGVGEQVGPRALAKQVDDLPAAAGVAAAGAAEGLAERAGEDVDAAHRRRDARACRGRSCP